MAYYFEGPEKNLEIWFKQPSNNCSPASSPSSPTTPSSLFNGLKHPPNKIGLRLIPRSKLEDMLAMVKCTILSSTHTDCMDSYVLSESSMFVSPFRIILKTCGTTTLLYAIPQILSLAKEVGLTEVQDLFYSRRRFGRPDLQISPHTSFDEEIEFLDSYFHGAAYVLGRINSPNQWYLYTLDRTLGGIDKPDQTLEIIMTDLDPTAMKSFFKSNEITCAFDVEKASGICDIFPDATLDGFLFEPCGYSVNAVMKDHYFTIHVTPQEDFSYVSFETDVPLSDYTQLINRVLKIFQPGKCTITVFTNHLSCESMHPSFSFKHLEGFVKHDSQTYDLEQYQLRFAQLVRKPLPAVRVATTASVCSDSDDDR